MQAALCCGDGAILDFGKNRGRRIDQVEDGYLRWMLKCFCESSQWHRAAAGSLSARGSARTRQVEQALLDDLKACSVKRDLQWGRRIHAKAVETQNDSNLYVASSLIKMYASCGSMADARQVFDRIEKPDVVSWNALLFGYAENGEAHVSLDQFSRMKADGCTPNSVTLVAALKACTSLAVNGDRAYALQAGSGIHLQVGDHLNLNLQNTLIEMYAKCGSMVHARQVFETIPNPKAASWNALLLGYAENGEERVALDLLSKTEPEGCTPNSVTYLIALKACTSLAVNGDGSGKAAGLEMGRKIHLQIGNWMDIFVESALIVMYAKCGSMAEALKVFSSIEKPDVVCWTALLSGYAENGEGFASLDLFSRMKADGCVPNSITYVAALKGCASLAMHGGDSGKAEGLETGSKIHLEVGEHLNLYVQNALIDMYAKCGSMVDAHRVFDTVRKPDVVCWTALLLGYAENGEGHVCLELFSKMEADGCAPDSIAYVAALKACGAVGALALGRKFHSDMTVFTLHVVTCLVDFYAKCGSMEEARAVFDQHSRARDITTWNALLAGYSSCGDTCTVFSQFEAMQEMGFRPDAITFVCILLCCSHAGLVKKAKQYLEAMPVQYKVIPDVFHYSCLVDAFGRANQLLEAVSVLRNMPCNPSAVTWSSLLGTCCKWRNVAIGSMAFQAFVAIDKDKDDSFAYGVMARIYGSRGMWEEQAKILEKRTRHGAWKPREQAFVEDGTGKMLQFVVGQEDLPEVEGKLAQLSQQQDTCSVKDSEDEPVRALLMGRTLRD